MARRHQPITQTYKHILEASVVVDKLKGDILKPIGGVHASGGDKTDGEVQRLLVDARLLVDSWLILMGSNLGKTALPSCTAVQAKSTQSFTLVWRVN